MTFIELQQRFVVGLERRLSEVTDSLAGARNPESLMLMFHSLAGIAGTYGFHRITRVSRECEEFCVAVMSANGTLTDENIGRLQRSVETMREAQASPEPSLR